MTESYENNTKTTVYFDGSCPLCVAEIGVYKKRNNGAVEFVDVSASDEAAASDDIAADLDRNKAMARFHVRNADGKLVDGGDAFAALWRATPGFRTLGRMGGLPVIRQGLNFAYDSFLLVRPFIQKAYKRAAGVK
ncbi:MAG: DUF393 domain-containing protein [Pseudomonadota bacterium]